MGVRREGEGGTCRREGGRVPPRRRARPRPSHAPAAPPSRIASSRLLPGPRSYTPRNHAGPGVHARCRRGLAVAEQGVPHAAQPAAGSSSTGTDRSARRRPAQADDQAAGSDGRGRLGLGRRRAAVECSCQGQGQGGCGWRVRHGQGERFCCCCSCCRRRPPAPLAGRLEPAAERCVSSPGCPLCGGPDLPLPPCSTAYYFYNSQVRLAPPCSSALQAPAPLCTDVNARLVPPDDGDDMDQPAHVGD